MLSALDEEYHALKCVEERLAVWEYCVLGQRQDEPVHEELMGTPHNAALPTGPSVYYSVNVYMDTEHHH